MAILLIGLIILLCGLAYDWLKPERRTQLSPSHPFTEQRTFDGLFAEQQAVEARQLAVREAQALAANERQALLARARSGDTATLKEAAAHCDAECYQQTLSALIESAAGELRAIEAIADYIINSRTLRANARLAELLMDCEPSAKSVARLLYIAALTDDERLYHRAAQTALRHSQENRLATADLRALLESSYWLIAPEIRQANFSLQQLMAEMRRALAATHAPSTQESANRARP